MTNPIGNISVPDGNDQVGDLRDLFVSLASQALRADPVKTADSLKEAGDGGKGLPVGSLVSLVNAASGDGIAAGHIFVVLPGGAYLADGAYLLNLETFVANLGPTTGVYVQPGRTFYDLAKGQSGIWTNSTGGHHLILDTTVVYGNGTLPSIAVHGLKTINISFPSGSFTVAPSYVDVTSHSGMLMPYANNITKDGFQANFRNVGYARSASVDHYSWAAFK